MANLNDLAEAWKTRVITTMLDAGASRDDATWNAQLNAARTILGDDATISVDPATGDMTLTARAPIIINTDGDPKTLLPGDAISWATNQLGPTIE